MAVIRSGLYRATFDWPEKRAEGAFLDVAHGAGVATDSPIRLGVGADYVGPLAPEELAFLKEMADPTPALLMARSFPASWRVTVAEIGV